MSYTKTCQLHCSPVYQSVTRDITAVTRNFSRLSVSDKVYENLSDIMYLGVSFSVSVNDAGYGRSGIFILGYQHIYKCDQKHCYSRKVMFSDCFKK